MINPVSTYRLQFHGDFRFADFEKILPYLQKLGIRTVYASPVFEAVPGSSHGYDALNPHKINPEIGTLEQWQNISGQLKQKRMYWLQDVVPNHMAFDTRNPWLMDILEKGRHSAYAGFFDAGWNCTVYQGKLMVPFLGSTLKEAIERGELKLTYSEPRLVLKYHDAGYPLGLSSYKELLQSKKSKHQAVEQLLQQIEQAQQTDEIPFFSERFEELKMQLVSLMRNAETRSYVDEIIDTVNADAGRVQQLAEGQIYRLCHWQETDLRINYRRFFTVNGLICLNMQQEAVFDHFHSFIRTLTDQKIVDGLRIDHIDGLYDPAQYLGRLKKLVGNNVYVVVEKILQQQENLPEDWKIEGSTGYEFLSMVNNLLTNKNGEKILTPFYTELAKSDTAVLEQIREKKTYILYHHMKGELENLYQLFMTSSLEEEDSLKNISPDLLKKAIGAFLVYCPVYRFYGNAFPLKEKEETQIHSLLEEIRQNEPQLSAGTELLKKIFLKNPHQASAEYNKRVSHLYRRCMQFSGPLMAKGVEDTLMYSFNRFIAHNEVGDSPETFGMGVNEFHRKMVERSEQWPLSVSTTSTHDTKRGEEVRARLNVLSELPDEWISKVNEWMRLNKPFKQNGAPEVNDEYFIYQSLLGAYPMPGEEGDDFLNRFKDYLQKALREAKIHSGWSKPNQEYEGAVKDFAGKLLNGETAFRKSFSAFHHRIADHGVLNSLVQVLLKFTSPGVPDTYQGSELWDLSFVDPDNRRPVDYAKRIQWLNEIEKTGNTKQLFQQLWQERFSGKIKLWLVHQLLKERNAEPDVFGYGDYIPLQTEGVYKEHILAFARRLKDTVYIIAVPVHVAGFPQKKNKTIVEWNWKDTRIKLPFALTSMGSVFEQDVVGKSVSVRIKDLFKDLPFALWKGKAAAQKRGAGILLHITSLPSRFGIGDLGPEASAFAGFLHRTHQKYWQLLPLNPVEQGQGYSPYSSTSSKAGNIFLISPEVLAEDGLLSKERLSGYYLVNKEKVDYAKAEVVKKELLETAWKNFLHLKQGDRQIAFKEFCEEEKEWLDDFALYMVLKQIYGGRPWYEWPEVHKHRDSKALQEVVHSHADEMEETKWFQFIFFKQWRALKNDCHSKGIQLIGDLPFYVSYDSADVWSHPQIFKLDKEGNRLAVAGVPPDAFSEDGQLWGMPVFNWKVLKDQSYDWWIGRLRKNTDLFDLIRLDHFRAFSSFWEVPAAETTARKGSWQKGPGAHFFKAVKRSLGRLPFIAEDLGDIDEPVYKLRDQFDLPGMNVLQFAFGDDLPFSSHSPHNYIQNAVVYTGTHDNNTTLGWFRDDKEHLQQYLKKYSGRTAGEADICFLLLGMAYGSVADIAVVPIQDVLGLDERARMNTPSSAQNNWSWRLLPGQISGETEKYLRLQTRIYNRL